jgi:DMSO/TMAO reductase YedYZ molybdopterin-dependent catalytic subunit
MGSGVALAAAALLHTLFPRVPFPPLEVSAMVVRATPGVVATFFIETFGHLALRLAVVATTAGFVGLSALLGGSLPRIAARLPRSPFGAAFALSTVPFALSLLAFEPDPTSVSLGAYALALLLVLVVSTWAAGATYRRLLSEPAPAPASGLVTDPSRRALVRGLTLGGIGFVVGWAGLGRLLVRRPNPGGRPLRLANVSVAPRPSPAEGDAAFDAVPGLSPEVTPLGSFYVVDEEIVDPDVDPEGWHLEIGGLVDRPYRMSYEELVSLPAVERYLTLECISNPVGGDLISTARWTGVPLAGLLARAGVRDGAVEVVSTAIGGYSDSVAVGEAMAPSALVAIGMNGHVLPREHGFPARLLLPGHYGMKQPKWLERIEVVDRPYTGYWEARGWSKAAVVKTMSRIDTAATGPDGTYVVAGVAFAGDRAISGVEVSTDGGASWREAELKTALSNTTWRLWRFELGASPSEGARVLARATDGDGEVQLQQVTAPHPSGATGYDEVVAGGP